MRFANRALVAGGLGVVVSALAGCGGSGSLLSPSQAASLKAQLAQVSQAIDTHQCQRAQNELQNFQSSVDSLPSVNQTLINNLDQGAQTISQLTQQRCAARATGRTTTTPTTTTRTAPTTTTTSPTTTTPTTTVPTTTTPTTTTPTTATQTTTTPATGGTGLGSGSGAQGSGTTSGGGVGAPLGGGG